MNVGRERVYGRASVTKDPFTISHLQSTVEWTEQSLRWVPVLW